MAPIHSRAIDGTLPARSFVFTSTPRRRSYLGHRGHTSSVGEFQRDPPIRRWCNRACRPRQVGLTHVYDVVNGSGRIRIPEPCGMRRYPARRTFAHSPFRTRWLRVEFQRRIQTLHSARLPDHRLFTVSFNEKSSSNWNTQAPSGRWLLLLRRYPARWLRADRQCSFATAPLPCPQAARRECTGAQ